MRIKEIQLAGLLLPLALVACGRLGLSAQENQASTATAGTQDASRVVTGDRTVGVGERIPEIVVVGGDLRVRGEVTGNAVVLNGNLILEESGVILGDAIITGGQIINQGGRVRGEMRTVDGDPAAVAGAVQRAPADAVEAARPSAQATSRAVRREVRDGFFTPVRRGIAGIISTVAFGLVLAGIGSALVFYGRPYLETVSDTVRGSTVRAGATGLAATFLVVPVFVVMIVALAVSIVGIPFLLVAIPLYPVAVFAAAVFGLLGAAHAIGERTSEQSRDALDLRYRNSYAYLFTGLAMLLAPHLVAHVVAMVGPLGFIGTLLRIVTVLAIWAAATVGFGAVILSRGGRRRTYATPDPMVPSFDADDFFADEPLGGQRHA